MAMSPDQTADLWLKIDQLHLNYLKAEENTSKLEIRKRLEGYVHQYLCLVPQERKFCNALTSVIFYESSRWITDFSALKAARAFEAIEKYAANLINQPWRKEFKEIKQYGGFYKHQVESALNSPERLFLLMGYTSSGQQSLILDGPVELDKVTIVARDCLLAYVECQIIVTILQGVTAQFPCRWDEILEFRRTHIGSPEQATRTLLYQKNQLHFAQTQQQQQQFYPYAPYAPPYSSNGFMTSPSRFSMHPATPSGLVPTGNLVDISPPGQNGSHRKNGFHDDAKSNSSNSTLTGQMGPIPLTIKQLEQDNRRKTLLAEAAAAAVNANEAKNPLESWDYVYRQLESIGYTKDQGERPDVLDLLSKVGMNPQHRKQLEQRLKEQQMFGFRQSSSETEEERCQPPPLRKQSPSPPALPVKGRRSRQKQQELQQTPPPPPPEKPPKLPVKKKSAPAPPPKYDSVEYEDDEEDDEDYDFENVVDTSKEWQCEFCTYLNSLEKDVCEMCSKSRRSVASTRSSHEEEEFVSGASQMDDPEDDDEEEESEEEESDHQGQIQCPKCTLYNPEHLNICTVCGASLHKAPIIANGGNKRPQSSASRSSQRR